MGVDTGRPIVGLVTACRNGSAWVDEMLRSVQAQDFGAFEHVIVDDGSTDDSAQVIAERISNDFRQRLVQTTGVGIERARSVGYGSLSDSAEFVGFPDADDLLEPSYLGTLVGFLERHPDAGAVASSFDRCDEAGRRIAGPRIERWAPASFGWPRLIPSQQTLTPFASIYCSAFIPEAVALLRRSVFVALGGWEQNLSSHGQSIRLFGLVALHSQFHLLDLRAYLYRAHNDQNSRGFEGQRLSRSDVYRWWDAHERALDTQRRAILRRARWFKARRLEPYLRLQGSVRLAKQRQYWRAAHYAARAVKLWARP